MTVSCQTAAMTQRVKTIADRKNSAMPAMIRVLIFMGVSGSGKTTAAQLFAQRTGAVFYEGDDFHPLANIQKMRAGIPLTDADREEWLRRLSEIIARAGQKRALTVLACSALKEKYRARLRGGDPCVKFVYLTGPPALIAERLSQRRGHFLAPSLLASQLATLEPPADALQFSCEQAPGEIVTALLQELGMR